MPKTFLSTIAPEKIVMNNKTGISDQSKVSYLQAFY